MSKPSAISLPRLCTAIVVFTAAMLLVAMALMSFGLRQDGGYGLRAGLIATLVCWLSGVSSLLVLLFFRDPRHSVIGVLLGMSFRMLPPLALGLFLLMSRSALLEAGVIGMTVVAYVVGLTVETGLCLWLLGAFPSAFSTRMAKAL